MTSVNTPAARQQTRTVSFEEWVLPIGNPIPAAALEQALDQATKDPKRNEQTVWYRLDQTPNGPVIVIGYNTETTETAAVQG